MKRIELESAVDIVGTEISPHPTQSENITMQKKKSIEPNSHQGGSFRIMALCVSLIRILCLEEPLDIISI
jgi:hypothetical protein